MMSRTEYTVDEGIGILMMNDPARLNPLDIAMDDELLARLEICEADPAVQVVVLGGKGRAFSAGGDMQFFREQIDSGRYEKLDEILTHVNRLILYMKTMRKLIVAAVQGHAAGGGANLALAADFIIADETMKFSEPFTKIGLAPDAGGMYLLSRAVGARKALELCVEHPVIDAAEADRLGLLTGLVPAGRALEEAVRYARELAAGPLRAYELAKVQNFAVNYADLETYLAVTERQTMHEAFRSVDFAEAVHAFCEKRPPRWKS